MTSETYRREVERLLEQIRRRVRELELLRTYGARSAALAEKKQDLRLVRNELAALVAAGSPAVA
jgi:hypothetical protein